jgi:hypothetical protein
MDMIESADRSQPPSPPMGRARGFSGTVGDELARLYGRKLGVCAACGRPVFVEQNFTRSRGRVVHVRCPITARTPSLM